jgi:hypothetical protein
MDKTIYCTKCQAETTHQASVERGDIIFTCQTADCGRFVKFPADMSPADLQAAVAAHKTANQGLEYMITGQQVIEAGMMTQKQIDDALAAISAL